MKVAFQPPDGCEWWSRGEETKYSPKDQRFVEQMLDLGFNPFVSSHGLFGAKLNDRYVDVIHRGRGRRWKVGFLNVDNEFHKEVHILTVSDRSDCLEAVTAWITAEPMEQFFTGK